MSTRNTGDLTHCYTHTDRIAVSWRDIEGLPAHTPVAGGVCQECADARPPVYRSVGVLKTWPDASMASGEPVWYQYPERTRIFPEDLYVHLSREYRYHGALPWTVLQHLALCVRLGHHFKVDAEAIPYIAAHDLHEAVVGDLATHLKNLIPIFKVIEDNWEAHIHRNLGLEHPTPNHIREAVKYVDNQALSLEMHMMGHALAEGVGERRGFVATEELRQVWGDVSQLSDGRCWAVLCNALPALSDEKDNRRCM